MPGPFQGFAEHGRFPKMELLRNRHLVGEERGGNVTADHKH